MAKQQGWISLHRQIQEHWLWEEKPFDKRSAWIDLLMLANHQDVKIPYKGKIITCKAGTVNRSILHLAERWGWGREKTRKFLDLLESDGMVKVNATKHRTTITIENYSKYAHQVTTNRQQIGNEPTTDRQQADINNNDNNDNNDNKERDAFVPPTIEEVSAYCRERQNSINPQQFMDYYQSNGWLVGKNKMKDWKASIRSWEKNSFGSKEPERKATVHRCPELDAIF